MKLFNYSGLLLLFYLGFVLSEGCQNDTCNDQETFLELTVSLLDSSMLPDPDQLGLNIEIESVADLPESYFQELFKITGPQGHSMENLDWQNDHGLIDSFLVVGTSNINLFLNSSVKDDLERTYEFHFSLPDRRGFIDCVHNGTGNTYYIDLRLKFVETTGLILIERFDWEETRSA